MARKFFVGDEKGNFKMNGSLQSLTELVKALDAADLDPNTEVVVAPPTLYLAGLQIHLANSSIKVSAQNCSCYDSGAYTGEVSASQLKDLGVHWSIIGHSERRTIFHETDEVVANKCKTCLSKEVSVILCVGESLAEREADKTMEVVRRQLTAVKNTINDWSNVVIAYEPVWAIGTGKVASSAQAQDVHQQIRVWLASEVSQETADATRIIYGGSVTAKNCKELSQQSDVDGFLVGGASLKPEFVDIVNSRK